MNKDSIKSLVNRSLDLLREMHYSDFCINRYEATWRCGICKYMEDNGYEFYDSTIGNEYLQILSRKQVCRTTMETWVRSIRILTEVLQHGSITRRIDHRVKEDLCGPFAEYARMFLEELSSLKRSEGTLVRYRVIISRFLTFLRHQDIENLEFIGDSTINSFISNQETKKVEINYVLRKLFRFWFENHIITKDLSDSFSSYRFRHHQRIPSFYSPDEIAIIENSVDRSKPLGKRNYALLLLATRLGLRASDIANLKMRDIDWRKNEINIIQQKTKNPVRLPLISVVGNAIIDFLKYGRPDFISSAYIFHSFKPPYDPMNGQAVSSAITSVIEGCSVEFKGRKHGPHAMRHSLATNLLHDSVPLPVISESLGHSSTEATTIYLSVDIPTLIDCSLEVPPVPASFYNMKGGAENG